MRILTTASYISIQKYRRCPFIPCDMLGPVTLREVKRLFGDPSPFTDRVK